MGRATASVTGLNARIQALLDELVATGVEVGLQVAVYVEGALVVDAWAGVADETTGRPVTGDTLFTAWSTTKGIVATGLHLLAERGRIDYDAPIATYWPEFAARGKGAATVRHALTHMAGVPQLPDGVTPALMADWDAMCAAIANLPPLWAPGSATGYHAWTFGWLIGELVRRVDGRPIDRFVREEVCGPLGIADFYLGIPAALAERVARLRQEPANAPPAATELAVRAMPPTVTTAEIANRPDIRRAVIPGGGGIMSARAVARHYALLAEGGALAGQRLLSPARIELLRSEQTSAPDLVLGRRVRKGLGYFLGGAAEVGGAIAMGRAGGAFGHPGNGGSLGFADPARRLGFGLTKTLMRQGVEADQTAAYRVAEAVRAVVDG